MTRPVGRPARPTTIDPDLLTATHAALLAIAKELRLPVDRYSDPITGKPTRRVEPLALAKLAIDTQEALEVLAAREVAASRELEGSTWGQVGEVFGISTQSAHHRFANK
ncbi:MAG: hypothetical protein R2733_17170 [Acidimicrobiales bacterium]